MQMCLYNPYSHTLVFPFHGVQMVSQFNLGFMQQLNNNCSYVVKMFLKIVFRVSTVSLKKYVKRKRRTLYLMKTSEINYVKIISS